MPGIISEHLVVRRPKSWSNTFPNRKCCTNWFIWGVASENENATLFHRGLPKSVGIDPYWIYAEKLCSQFKESSPNGYLPCRSHKKKSTRSHKKKKHTLQRLKCWHLAKKQEISLKSPKTTSRWWHLVELLNMYFTWNFFAHLHSGNNKHLFGGDAHVPGRSARPFQQPSSFCEVESTDFGERHRFRRRGGWSHCATKSCLPSLPLL